MINFKKFFEGLRIIPKTTSNVSQQGDLDVSSTTSKLNYHNGTTSSPMVTEAHSATLTNKTIDADQNTLSNIENADIKAGAAIARNKLASGTASVVLVNDGSGVLSDSTVTTTELNKLSGISGNLTTDSNTQTLTNKSIDGATNTLTNIPVNSATGVLPVANGGTNSSTALSNNRVIQSSGGAIVEAAAITANRALASDANGIPVHTAVTDTELGYVSGVTSSIQTQLGAKITASSSDTLTNKTIDGDTNTLQDIAITSLKTDGAAPNTFISRDVSGVVISTKAVPTGTVVGTSDAQVITAKDIDGGTASNTSRITVPKASKATLDALTRKQGTIVYGSDTNKLYTDDGTILNAVGAGSGGINYISNPDAESNTTGYGTYNNSASILISVASPAVASLTVPPLANPFYVGQRISFSSTGSLPTGVTTGTDYYVTTILSVSDFNFSLTPGGANVNTTGSSTGPQTAHMGVPLDGSSNISGSPTITITRSTSAPLRGLGSFLITKASGNLQGEGVNAAFTIDSADKAKMLSLSFDYQLASGAINPEDIAIWIYDVTNSRLIQPTATGLDGVVLGQNYQYQGYFPTASNSTSYRLIIHQSSFNTAAYTLKFDNVAIGPQVISAVSPVSDFQSYNPTFDGFGTVSSTSVYYKRIGDSISVSGSFQVGTVTGSEAAISLPPGMQIDLNKVSVTNNSQIIGTFSTTNSTIQSLFSSDRGGYLAIDTANPTKIKFINSVTNTALIFQAGNALIGSNQLISVKFDVPIAGFGSSITLGQMNQGRQVAALIAGNPQLSYTNDTPIVFPTVVVDTTGSYNTSTGEYIASKSMLVDISLFINTDVATSLVKAWVNGVASYALGNSNSGFVQGSGTVKLNAGDVLTIRNDVSWTALGSASQAFLSIQERINPAVVAPTETIACALSGDPANASAGNPIIFPTKDYDTHGAYNTATGVFTAPAPGLYKIYGYAEANNPGEAIILYLNGVSNKRITTMGATYATSSFCVSIKLDANDELTLCPTGAGLDLNSNSSLSIERFGI